MEKRILIFDDDESFLAIIKFILEEKGWEVVGFDSSKDVVEKVKAIQPAIIMMDNQIPDHGGIIATQRIKQQKEFDKIPVIFCSASYNPESLSKEAGADVCLNKPFDLSDLSNIIEMLFLKSA